MICWCVKHNNALLAAYLGRTRKSATGLLLANETIDEIKREGWAWYKRHGYSVVKVEVRELGDGAGATPGKGNT